MHGAVLGGEYYAVPGIEYYAVRGIVAVWRFCIREVAIAGSAVGARTL